MIDDALDTLSDHDRQVVILRYFEAQRFAEIGRVFGISEEAARKRTDRALDCLRDALARRGITSTAGAVGVLLETSGIEAAPAGLASSVIATATPTAGTGIGFCPNTPSESQQRASEPNRRGQPLRNQLGGSSARIGWLSHSGAAGRHRTRRASAKAKLRKTET